jgi:hypothetical protein
VKIIERDLCYGAALAQIVEHLSFQALNHASPRTLSRNSSKYGHYLVNTDRHVFVKCSTRFRGPWKHTLSKDEVQAIAAALASSTKLWLCLVCGNRTICALDKDEIGAVLDLAGTGQQWIRVDVPKGGGCHVTGSHGNLRRPVPHNSYPKKVFA